jgi:hypothetical protein
MTAGPADNCGECLTPDRSVTEHPYWTEPAPLGALRAYYRCRECGCRWFTTFIAEPSEKESAA